MNARITFLDKTVMACAIQRVTVVTKQQVSVIMDVILDGGEASAKKHACPEVLVCSVITVVDIASIRQHVTILLEFAIKSANLDINQQTVLKPVKLGHMERIVATSVDTVLRQNNAITSTERA